MLLRIKDNGELTSILETKLPLRDHFLCLLFLKLDPLNVLIVPVRAIHQRCQLTFGPNACVLLLRLEVRIHLGEMLQLEYDVLFVSFITAVTLLYRLVGGVTLSYLKRRKAIFFWSTEKKSMIAGWL